MPKPAKKKVSRTKKLVRGIEPRKLKFLRCFVKEGGVPEKIRAAEKRGRFRAGTGEEFLKDPAVRQELTLMLAPLKAQSSFEDRLRTEVEKVTAALERDKEALRQEINQMKSVKGGPVDAEVLEDRLMRLTGLDPEKYGSLVLDAIQTGFVVRGLMEGKMRRVAPQKRPEDEPNVESTYQGLFSDMRLEASAGGPHTIEGDSKPAPVLPLEVSDLYPPAPPPAAAPEDEAAQPDLPAPLPPRAPQQPNKSKSAPLVIEVE